VARDWLGEREVAEEASPELPSPGKPLRHVRRALRGCQQRERTMKHVLSLEDIGTACAQFVVGKYYPQEDGGRPAMWDVQTRFVHENGDIIAEVTVKPCPCEPKEKKEEKDG
jgi:hypothetical protein